MNPAIAPQPTYANLNLIISVQEWAVFLFFILFVVFALVILRKLIKKYAEDSKYFDNVIYLVRLPKERPQDSERENTLQKLHEEISRGETIFSAIGGLRAQRGITAWLFGRNDHFSFEIVASQKLISFYVVAPRHRSRYLEQQIQAHYPEAVLEEVDDYNIFKHNSEIAAGFLKTKREFILPLKTYNTMEADPMNSIINVMSKLNSDEGMAVQYIVRSAHKSWHRRGKEVVSRAYRTNSVREALAKSGRNSFINVIADIAQASKPQKPKINKQWEQPKRMTAMEEQMLKGIEEKNSKAGLDVNLRFIASASDKGKAVVLLENMASVYSQYNYYEYGNSFNRIMRRREKKIINDYIYRRFDDRLSFLLNSEELTGLYHFPLRHAETPNILWLTAKRSAAPANVPNEGIILGYNIFRGVEKEIRIKRDDRRRHTYVVGKSGVGKSQLMANMAIQDILNGEGVCVIDPHGDLVKDILLHMPPERAEDVIVFAPADTERPLALNLLEYDPDYPEQKTFVINEMIKIFDKLYDLKSSGGPIFEQYIRNAMLLVMSDPESGSTLMEIPKVLADPEFRKLKLERCKDVTVVDFWRKEAEKAGGEAALANIVPYITSKLTSFISNDTMRPIIGQQKSSFNLRQVMDRRKILLVDLSKGLIGELNAHLLGMILVGKILFAALSRTDMPQDQRKDFYLYIDEFQNFTTDSISAILSEARKYNLNLIIAHQYLGQLEEKNNSSIKKAVFGNVGTWISFKVGSEDAAVIEKEMLPVFNQFDLVNVDKYTAYVKLLVDNATTRPFSMTTPWPLFGPERPDLVKRIKSLSRLKHGQDRNIIEAEIMRRTKITEKIVK